ncbi:MAG: hypothetical protein H6682_18570 [Candidatus Eisenbacteria bacterium]|nr:hypothetical protein [Candidatus Eisenbacteria bacterium]
MSINIGILVVTFLVSGFATVSAATELRLAGGVALGFSDYDAGTTGGTTNNGEITSRYGGIQIVLRGDESLGFETGIQYGGTGGEASYAPLSGSLDAQSVEWTFHYVGVPLRVRLQRPGSSPFLKVGVCLDLLTRTDFIIGGRENGWNAENPDLSLLAGGGLDIPTSPVPMFIELEGAWGLRNAFGISVSTLRNRTLRLGVGLVWPRGNDI